MKNHKLKIVIAGGGTGGHIYPGVAIARAIESSYPSAEIIFVGSKLGLETKIIPREGFPLVLLPAGKLNYAGSIFGKIKTVLVLPFAFLKALFWLLIHRPKFVLGVGGYASGPIVFVASLLQIPTAIWEPNAHPGMTNRWLSRFVKKCYYVFDQAPAFFNCKNVMKVGLPVRSELELMTPSERTDKDFHVLVFGGSQGARFINEVILKSVQSEAQWLHQSRLIHQTGVNDYPRIQNHFKQSIFSVECFEYLHEMNKYYDWADLVICRSGASTVAELAAVGKPAILVPLPNSADDHQRKNAESVASKGGAIWVEQKNLTPEWLNQMILDLQKNPEQLKKMGNHMRSLHVPMAAQIIALDILNKGI